MVKDVSRQIALREKETGHSVMGPSSLPRIMACPASAFESLKVTVPRESSYARRGTFHHDTTEHFWNKPDSAIESLVDVPVATWNTEFKDQEPITDEECGWLLDCRDYLRDIIADLHGNPEPTLEQRVSLVSWGIPEVWGTCDVSVGAREVIHIIDWKFGSGVAVYPDNNPQTRSYAAGDIGYPNNIVKEINIHIVQPPLNIFESETLTYEDMKGWVFDELQPAINLARENDAPYVPGEKQCRWCPAAMTCKARRDQADVDASEIFSQFLNTSIEKIDIHDLVEFYHKSGAIVKYREQIAKYLMEQLNAGEPVPEMKLVSGRSNRAWKDVDDAFHYLKNVYKLTDDDLYTKKPISPAQAEKKARKAKKDDDFQDLVKKPPGKPQLVGEDDPREALNPNLEASKTFEEFKTAN